MEHIQQLGNLHMAIYINNKLYEKGKITCEMFEYAKRFFMERLYEVEKGDARVSNKAG